MTRRNAWASLLTPVLVLCLFACSDGGGSGSEPEPVSEEPPAGSDSDPDNDVVNENAGPFLLDSFGFGSFEDMRALVHPAVTGNSLEAALMNCTVMVAE
ncbi:MAG: hypothetical protein HUJ31_16925, partial [Pseudomonadales bacterium]|nr:hypothetical protein [Pseudomonadales bacterium]